MRPHIRLGLTDGSAASMRPILLRYAVVPGRDGGESAPTSEEVAAAADLCGVRLEHSTVSSFPSHVVVVLFVRATGAVEALEAARVVAVALQRLRPELRGSPPLIDARFPAPPAC